MVDAIKSFTTLEAIGLYPPFEKLELNMNVTSIPKQLAKQTFLLAFLWRKTAISILPADELRYLERLRVVFLGGNLIEDVPESTRHLRQVEFINLRGNLIAEVPYSISELYSQGSLTTLALDVNPICSNGFLEDETAPPAFVRMVKNLVPCQSLQDGPDGGSQTPPGELGGGTSGGECVTKCREWKAFFHALDLDKNECLAWSEVDGVYPALTETEFIYALQGLEGKWGTTRDPNTPLCGTARIFSLFMSTSYTDCSGCTIHGSGDMVSDQSENDV